MAYMHTKIHRHIHIHRHVQIHIHIQITYTCGNILQITLYIIHILFYILHITLYILNITYYVSLYTYMRVCMCLYLCIYRYVCAYRHIGIMFLDIQRCRCRYVVLCCTMCKPVTNPHFKKRSAYLLKQKVLEVKTGTLTRNQTGDTVSGDSLLHLSV